MVRKFWNDDSGAVLTTEFVFFITLLVIGLVAGLKSVQTAVLTELEEVAGAIGALSQSWSVGGTQGCCSSTSGSQFVDTFNTFPVDTCTGQIDAADSACPD